ncbi:unnamed protein product, partial [Rotaria magnacalcarata]
MILDLAGTISQLVDRVETHQDKVERQFKNLSNNKENIVMMLYWFFVYVKEYNSQNLLGIYDAGSYGRFAPKVMKILFSSPEMCQSIIYSNSVCEKSMLDPD